LSDSCIHSDDGQATASGNGAGGSGGCNGGYNDADDNNEDSVLCDENNHDIYTTPFHASSDYKPPRSRLNRLFLYMNFCATF
jgi:hypothetical protein